VDYNLNNMYESRCKRERERNIGCAFVSSFFLFFLLSGIHAF